MIVFTELAEGRSDTAGVQNSARIPFLAESLIGDMDESLVEQFAFANLASRYNGLILATVEVEQRISESPARWRIMANYAEYPSQFSFDFSGGTQHITNALTHVASYGAWKDPANHGLGKLTPTDHKGAINADENSVNGVDITVPVYNFSETHYFPAALVTPAYKSTLCLLTGRINSDSFRGFQPGEVLFLGACGSKRGYELWELQYRFSASPNQTNLQIGDIEVAAKGGWDYLWVEYEAQTDANAKRIARRPIAAHVETVYRSGSFANLGLGNG